MADYREFLRILENQHSGRAVGFEYRWDKSLAEQLVWRRGDTLWKTEQDRVQTLMTAALRCGLDCVALELEEAEGKIPILPHLGKMLPSGMKAAVGMTKGLWESRGNLPAFLQLYRRLAEEPAVCAVIVRDRGEAFSGSIAEYRQSMREISGEIHRTGKPCIWADCGEQPIPLEWIAGCGFDAVHLTAFFPQDTADIWREYHSEFALLGDTRMDWVLRQKPRDIIAYCEFIQNLTENCGYAFGMGNPSGKPISYLTYVSVLTALARGQR
ncbi:MAG: hypothetical protein ACOX6P_06320 [Candidatus Merdivicinus sp.]|jgi:hypothetical protein